jgi:hypothetical protein
MPMIRGRFVPQIESTGRPKKCMDILLWGTDWAEQSQRDFDNLEVLRDYLRSIRPIFCDAANQPLEDEPDRVRRDFDSMLSWPIDPPGEVYISKVTTLVTKSAALHTKLRLIQALRRIASPSLL